MIILPALLEYPSEELHVTPRTNYRQEMSITKERKDQLITEYRRGDGDTGSPEVQIALLTHRIAQLTEHLKAHHKDHASRRGLLMLVSKRRRLQKYLQSHNPQKYVEVIERLGLRK